MLSCCFRIVFLEQSCIDPLYHFILWLAALSPLRFDLLPPVQPRLQPTSVGENLLSSVSLKTIRCINLWVRVCVRVCLVSKHQHHVCWRLRNENLQRGWALFAHLCCVVPVGYNNCCSVSLQHYDLMWAQLITMKGLDWRSRSRVEPWSSFLGQIHQQKTFLGHWRFALLSFYCSLWKNWRMCKNDRVQIIYCHLSSAIYATDLTETCTCIEHTPDDALQFGLQEAGGVSPGPDPVTGCQVVCTGTQQARLAV